MNTQDQSLFKELLLTISEVYNHVFTEAQTKIWWNIFKPYSLEEFNKGVYAYLSCPSQGMFNPKPASIIKMIIGSEKACDDDIYLDGVFAWDEVFHQTQPKGLHQDHCVVLSSVRSVLDEYRRQLAKFCRLDLEILFNSYYGTLQTLRLRLHVWRHRLPGPPNAHYNCAHRCHSVV